ncbi:MAG: HAD hydrolase-like protein [Kiritimatiellae bacterium]|nr:HAD hydrolase-like protein [Kiritimatiellia bacterium]MDD5523028.1 HAD hydrolase-like protein [Kiritimatiellia bacterium]
MVRTYAKDDLINLTARHSSFVGVDSDGCVFDTMEIKQKTCFHTLIISHWKLEPVEKYIRETAEFVNLYSKWRGTNRFIALDKMFDLLRERKEIIDSGVRIPKLKSMKKFMASGVALGNPELEKNIRETGDSELKSILKWSNNINKCIKQTVKNIPPFKWVRESFDKIVKNSDMICVSQTPTEALVREWKENNLMKYPCVIAGQELGTKTEHIALATKDKYNPDKILMIGDAPGDMKAATENNAHFYPINPAHETASWERFYKEAYDKFLSGTYGGKYEETLIAEFELLLPDKPAWGK